MKESSAFRPPPAALALALAICAAVPLAYRIASPFLTPADNNTAIFAQAARNYVRHGLVATKLGITYNAGDELPARFAFNTHHPPLFVLPVALVYLVAGVTDWGARIYPAVCSLGSVLALFFVLRRARGETAAALSCLVMATLPAFGHFGKMLGEEAPALFFALLALMLYQRWKSSPRRRRGSAAGCLFAYAAACLSGWAGFYMGPLLMADATLSLRRDQWFATRAVAGFGLAGLIAFGLIAGQVVLLAGSAEPLSDAAADRLRLPAAAAGGGAGPAPSGGLETWLRREALYFQRLYGEEAGWLACAGLLAGAVAVARRRADREAALTLVVLALFGAAHPIVFPGAAFPHDWLLFPLLPAVGVAVAEGILLAGRLAERLRRAVAAPLPEGAAAIAIVVIFLAHRAASGAGDLARLASEDLRYAGPLLGRAIDARAPVRSYFMVNHLEPDGPFRFYADRPFGPVSTAAEFERRRLLGRCALYMRQLNVPIEPALEKTLGRYPATDVAGYRLYDLWRRPDDAGAGPSVVPGLEQVKARTLDVRFGDALRLTACEIFAPAAAPSRVGELAAFFGLGALPTQGSSTVTAVTTWEAAGPDLPSWRLMAGLSLGGLDASPTVLPLISFPDDRHPLFSRWSGQGRFQLVSSFAAIPGAPPGDYDLGLAVSDGGRPVSPSLPGPPRPLLKVLRIHPIPLFEPAARATH